ncbi:hypothetical protein ACMV5I_06635 [Serratia sp. T13T92]|uniref:hypothetical protein n=1 Tax=Serratia sp. T13T92 TaxID=3397496 RepID=UPI0039E008BE
MIGKRKFVSEFSVGITSNGWLMLTPDQLHAEGKMNDAHQDISDNSHIYLICKKPKTNCSNEEPVISVDQVTGKVISRIDGTEVVSEYSFPFAFIEDEVALRVSSYPHRKIETVNAGGEWKRYWPSEMLALFTSNPIYYDLEVLYVGQAYADGKRTAIERLRSHSTLQKILADTMNDFPDDQIYILTLVYSDYILFSSFNGADKTCISGQEDLARLKSIIDTPLSKKEIVCLSEAGLIRYFNPKYNIIYKGSFPSSDQKILSGCFDLDFSGLSVEIELNGSNFRLYSKDVSVKHHHTAMFNLVDEEKRLGFFTLSNGNTDPITMTGVIPLTK